MGGVSSSVQEVGWPIVRSPEDADWFPAWCRITPALAAGASALVTLTVIATTVPSRFPTPPSKCCIQSTACLPFPRGPYWEHGLPVYRQHVNQCTPSLSGGDTAPPSLRGELLEY
ncbi:unnamed protein product [Boreogadus saida]